MSSFIAVGRVSHILEYNTQKLQFALINYRIIEHSEDDDSFVCLILFVFIRILIYLIFYSFI